MQSLGRRVGTLALVLGSISCAPLLDVAGGQTAAATGSRDQVVTWGASTDLIAKPVDVVGRTVRNLVHTSIAGNDARISLSNAYGDGPVTLSSVRMGVQQLGASLTSQRQRPVSFGGTDSVTISPGGQAISDPIRGRIHADTTVAVSAYVEAAPAQVTGHNLAMQTSYVSEPGDVADDRDDEAFTTEIQSWYWLDSLTVDATHKADTVAMFGDSITDGHSSTPDSNRRWPDLLADRLAARPAGAQYGVLNAGISANRMLGDSGGGQAGRLRFDRDVLQQPDIETVIVLEGINDIRWDLATEPADLTRAYQEIIRRAHAQGVCVVGGTLTPFEGGSRYTPEREQVRTGVNDWIRQYRGPDGFDAVVDFDAVTRDPARPVRFLPSYDSGDHLHPGDSGYAAMAEAVPAAVLDCRR